LIAFAGQEPQQPRQSRQPPSPPTPMVRSSVSSYVANTSAHVTDTSSYVADTSPPYYHAANSRHSTSPYPSARRSASSGPLPGGFVPPQKSLPSAPIR
jgi:hypothetical protein